jgi:hypothetical protein
LSFTLLNTKLLANLDEDVYSAANVRRVCAEAADETKKGFGLQRLEFDTGLMPDFKLNGKYRVWDHLIQLVREMAKLRDHRGRTIPLKKAFDSENGVFNQSIKVTLEGELVVSVKHVLTGSWMILHPSRVPACKGDGLNLYIDKNFSERRAVLRSKLSLDDEGVCLHALFDHKEFPTVPLSLTAGVAEDPAPPVGGKLAILDTGVKACAMQKNPTTPKASLTTLTPSASASAASSSGTTRLQEASPKTSTAEPSSGRKLAIKRKRDVDVEIVVPARPAKDPLKILMLGAGVQAKAVKK